ncbi:S-adenosyl-L-methionine-dependent methyltransferase [Aspergillus filifer]
MARVLSSLRRVLGLNPPSVPAPSPSPSPSFQAQALRSRPRPRAIDADFSHIREGDRVIVWGAVKKKQHLVLSAPLRHGQKFDTPRGFIKHDEMIGRQVRDVVATNKGTNFRLTHPTLDQYVALTPRHVTPIYAQDASVIVSLLDIHVTPPVEGEENNRPPLEILESGTGHGALTLHISRAIQAANTLAPTIPKPSQVKYLSPPLELPTRKDTSKDTTKNTKSQPTQDELAKQAQTQQEYDAWRARRNAILHTVEVSPTFSTHAEKLVRGFYRGIYAGNIDFYVGRVESWVAEQIKQRKSQTSETVEPFLTHAILDMPSAHLRIPHVNSVLKSNGVLAVFMPSVTQIASCVELIKKQGLPLDLERVVELGTGISGGRLWDVKVVQKKSKADPGWDSSFSSERSAEDQTESTAETEVEGESVAEESSVGETPEAQQPVLAADSKEAVVCRPKPGIMTSGGGFVGIWRKIREEDT